MGDVTLVTSMLLHHHRHHHVSDVRSYPARQQLLQDKHSVVKSEMVPPEL